TLVLAVIPAYVRIRNTHTASFVQQLRKEPQTLGVLTMADRANAKGVDRFAELRARLKGASDDCIPLPHGFVAVRNRDTKDSPCPSLDESSETERAWFDVV